MRDEIGLDGLGMHWDFEKVKNSGVDTEYKDLVSGAGRVWEYGIMGLYLLQKLHLHLFSSRALSTM